ncbi:hypothetical protein SCLCIDRAFT_135289 [Scleroderma citrinum Foug A]|uniref:Fungal-type protein kinase domain-containing protein n=1 Tax=Scleroderma citrinum Foug A TaxID=1036808 RepID=A0A0C2Z021_9AGAM|nr:hypothetical protein SCLCIDRAFT_135289 [Scleroderma citrinum Foug A]
MNWHWHTAPPLHSTASTKHEVPLSLFFNEVLECAKQAFLVSLIYYRKWDGSSSTCPLKGGDATRKPDISCWFPGSEFDWRHIAMFAEVKNHAGKPNEKTLYIEVAGKASCLLYAQGGRHATFCIHILGSEIFFTIFDHGRSLSTCSYNIHQCP